MQSHGGMPGVLDLRQMDQGQTGPAPGDPIHLGMNNPSKGKGASGGPTRMVRPVYAPKIGGSAPSQEDVVGSHGSPGMGQQGTGGQPDHTLSVKGFAMGKGKM